MQSENASTSGWPRRMAWALAVCTFLLLLVGGLVTTYRVGMAVPDWPTTFGHGMFSYPLEEMLEDSGVSIEHSHRLFAALVGMLTIGMVVACFLGRASRALRTVSLVALVVVIGQGLLGGTRVLENSRHLAFLHGAFAQVFYAIVAVLWVLTSSAWTRAKQRPGTGAPSLRRTAVAATIAVYAQIVVGAWLRHSGRTDALIAHGLLAFAVLATVIKLAVALSTADVDDGAPLLALRRWLIATLAVQVTLGLAATFSILVWSEGFEGAVSVGEAITATLHVAVGALLLAGCVASVLWSPRVARAEAVR